MVFQQLCDAILDSQVTARNRYGDQRKKTSVVLICMFCRQVHVRPYMGVSSCRRWRLHFPQTSSGAEDSEAKAATGLVSTTAWSSRQWRSYSWLQGLYLVTDSINCHSSGFWMSDAKNNAGCCLSHWQMTDCTSGRLADANFCPSSIFFVGSVQSISNQVTLAR